MAMSRAEYYRSILDQVLAVVKLPPTAQHLPWNSLRERIEKLAGEQLLTAGVADFWLDLGVTLGRKRRKDPTVPSPFWPVGKQTVAKKAPIAAWHDAWNQREAAKHLEGARTLDTRKLYSSLTADPCPVMIGWFDGRETVIGHAVWLPAAFSEEVFANQPEAYDIHWMRPDQALRMPWHDRAEAHLWLAIVRAAHRMEEADLERVRLDMDAQPASGEPSRGGRITL